MSLTREQIKKRMERYHGFTIIDTADAANIPADSLQGYLVGLPTLTKAEVRALLDALPPRGDVKRKCATCRFYDGHDHDEGGNCHRRAPTETVTEYNDGRSPSRTYRARNIRWVYVSRDEFCGEWEPREVQK